MHFFIFGKMKPLFLIFFSILSLFGYSQSKQIDSLFKKKKFKGIKFHPRLDEFNINDKCVHRVLKKYQVNHHIDYKNWDFLTGNEAETHRLGIQHFLTFAGKDSESAGGYAHSGSFTLVDAKGYVRGVYAVTNFDLSVNEQEFDRMVKEIKILYDEHTSTK